MYIKLEDGVPAPYSVKQLRKDHPNVSFPVKPSLDTLASYGVYPVITDPKPAFEWDEMLVENTTFSKDNQTYTRGWTVSKVNTARKEELLADIADVQRHKRNALLADCDWVVIKAAETGSAISKEWAAYRQALRDITTQDGFPHNIKWPEAP